MREELEREKAVLLADHQAAASAVLYAGAWKGPGELGDDLRAVIADGAIISRVPEIATDKRSAIEDGEVGHQAD